MFHINPDCFKTNMFCLGLVSQWNRSSLGSCRMQLIFTPWLPIKCARIKNKSVCNTLSVSVNNLRLQRTNLAVHFNGNVVTDYFTTVGATREYTSCGSLRNSYSVRVLWIQHFGSRNFPHIPRTPNILGTAPIQRRRNWCNVLITRWEWVTKTQQ